MNFAEAETDIARDKVRSNSAANVCLWLLVTLLGAALLAFLAGSATPRVRLLVLFPLAMGILVAYAALSLAAALDLGVRGWMIGWIVVLAACVPAGSTVQSWRAWRSDLREQRVAFMQQIDRMMEQALNQEDAEKERRKLMQAFAEKTSFSVYLSHRLMAFSQQMGRQEVWAPPLPEMMFAFELFVSAIGALFFSLRAWRFRQGPPLLEGSAS